jgi:hypothetical protein
MCIVVELGEKIRIAVAYPHANFIDQANWKVKLLVHNSNSRHKNVVCR